MSQIAALSGQGFQSTHPRGVRRGADLPGPGMVGRFNPRTREGCDTSISRIRARLMVSIHAPARGATYMVLPAAEVPEVSIHAPARGATANS